MLSPSKAIAEFQRQHNNGALSRNQRRVKLVCDGQFWIVDIATGTTWKIIKTPQGLDFELQGGAIERIKLTTMETTVKYFKRISEHEYQPHSHSLKDRKMVMEYRDSVGTPEAWCSTCKAVVEPEGKVNVQGCYNVCPFCNKELS